VLEFANITDENDDIPGAESGTMAWFSYVAYPPADRFNGDGTFFNMTFNVIGLGASALKLNSVGLADESGAKLLWHQYDGRFSTPGAPIADFTFWPDVGVVNRSVIFNASASYSPVDLAIDNYKWDFGDGNITSVSDPIVHHTYDATRDYTVSLKVTDSEGIISSPKTVDLTIVEKRNVKITNIEIEAFDVRVNTTVGLNITVTNDGRADENFTVTAYYNASEVNFADVSATNWIKIGEKNVSLTRNTLAILHLVWNTTGVPEVDASYYVMANTTFVPYEMNTTDNTKISAVPVFIIPEFPSAITLLLIMASMMLVLILTKKLSKTR
jgi:PKD repeat protein